MQCTIYIQKANEEAWKAIENKSEWVNDNLSGVITDKKLNDVFARIKGEDSPSTIYPIITSRNKDLKFCKHNAVVGMCKKGCK